MTKALLENLKFKNRNIDRMNEILMNPFSGQQKQRENDGLKIGGTMRIFNWIKRRIATIKAGLRRDIRHGKRAVRDFCGVLEQGQQAPPNRFSQRNFDQFASGELVRDWMEDRNIGKKVG